MKHQNLEDRLRKLTRDIAHRTYDITRSGLEAVCQDYEAIHSKYPIITNYLASAIGTVGGDAIAKQFTDNPDVTLRDVAFTASAATVYSYLAPKMIEWSTKVTDKISTFWRRLKENKVAHTLFNTTLLTALYFPVNMAYWNYLTIKNQAPITLENNKIGAITLGIATIPYLIADYVAIKKFSQPETTKYLRPFYSAVEILWNTLFAGGNYLAKKP
jgi:hypothetical protein